jgi:hypothetical protein
LLVDGRTKAPYTLAGHHGVERTIGVLAWLAGHAIRFRNDLFAKEKYLILF